MNARLFRSAAVFVMSVLLLSCGVMCGQTSSAEQRTEAGLAPSFDVATIKPSDPMRKDGGLDVQGQHVKIGNIDMTTLISVAYSVHPKQIVDAPEWFGTAHWDIEGVANTEREPTIAQVQQMLQKLLADRFGLKIHRDQRQIPVYALTIAKGGPKLTKSASDPSALPSWKGNGGGDMRFRNTSMTAFLLDMQNKFDRPLVDQTGLDGKYDFSLRWTPDETPSANADAPPGMFTAIQEQLGLKMLPVKAPANVLVVESVTKPSGN